MSGHRVTLSSKLARERAHGLIDRAPPGYVVKIEEPRRTNAQNDLLWSLLTDVACAKPMGRKLVPSIWKCLFMDALDGEQFKARWEPALDGDGVVNTGHRSSKLSKAAMSDLIESIYAFGAEHGVVWSHEQKDMAA